MKASLPALIVLAACTCTPVSAAGEQSQEQSKEISREVFLDRLVKAAVERTRHRVVYDPSYVVIPYPGGDVPADRGVCTDVIVRAYRKLGVDLQKDVHEDMRDHFSKYPKIWGLTKPDKNIDHRRVQNLMTLFKRHGEVLPISKEANGYSPGDLVCWDLPSNMKHIGIVIDRKSGDGRRPLVVHNIGAGPKAEDVLFSWKIVGHFRYFGGKVPVISKSQAIKPAESH